MAWTSPMTAVANTALTAAQWNTHVRDNLNETAPSKATTANRWFITTGANAIAERAIESATVATNQSTTSTSYTDLTTSGPAVTLTTGAAVLLSVNALLANATAGADSYMAFAVSGATTVAASDTQAIIYESPGAADKMRCGEFMRISGLTPGSNTFTAKYRASAGTAFFTDRHIVVMAL